MPLQYVDILSCWHLENNKWRKRLSLTYLYLPKDRSSKRSSVVIYIPSLEILSTRENGRLSERDTTLRLHDKLSQLLCSLLRAHLSFLKIIYSPLRSLRWNLILNSKLPQTVAHLSWVSPCIHKLYMLISLCFFVNMCFITGVSAKYSYGKGKLFFPYNCQYNKNHLLLCNLE